MRHAPLAIALVAWLSTPVSAPAQHAEGSAASMIPELSGCGMCHTSHAGGPGAYNLRTDDLPGLGADGIPGAPGLSAASASCLRCHTSPAVRARQPEFQRGAAPMARGKYLSLDLSDDHPLGRPLPDDWSKLESDWRPIARDPWTRDRLTAPGANPARVQCTTCHDPHSRAASTPTGEQEKRLCGRCHDPVRYAFQSHTALACTDCHKLHGADGPDLLAGTGDETCRSCHEAGAARPGDWPERAAGPTKGPVGHREPVRGVCTQCHRSHRQ